MCGRLALYTPAEDLAQWLDADMRLELTPHYNLAPDQNLAGCRLDNDGRRELVALHWGLVPHWSKGPDSRYSMINARADTVEQKPAYREPFRHKRCLIPANGFFEWQRSEHGKQPYYFHLQQDTPLAFAGLWDRWQGEDRTINSATIIVTEANELMRPIHDRMPVILSPDQWQQWLDPDQSLDDLKAMLRPYTGNDLTCYPVSKTVNNARNDRSELLQPVEPE